MRIRLAEPEKARIEMIPIIDSVFLILAYFLCSFLSMSARQSIPMDLPTSQTAVASQERRVTIGVSSEGALFLEKEPVTLRELKVKLREMKGFGPSVYLYADRNAAHGNVIEVLDLLRLEGLNQVLIETQPARSNESP